MFEGNKWDKQTTIVALIFWAIAGRHIYNSVAKLRPNLANGKEYGKEYRGSSEKLEQHLSACGLHG